MNKSLRMALIIILVLGSIVLYSRYPQIAWFTAGVIFSAFL